MRTTVENSQHFGAKLRKKSAKEPNPSPANGNAGDSWWFRCTRAWRRSVPMRAAQHTPGDHWAPSFKLINSTGCESRCEKITWCALYLAGHGGYIRRDDWARLGHVSKKTKPGHHGQDQQQQRNGRRTLNFSPTWRIRRFCYLCTIFILRQFIKIAEFGEISSIEILDSLFSAAKNKN